MELTLDHVAIAVTSIAEAQPVLESLMGGHSCAVERVEAQGVDVVFIGEGAGRLELLEPTRADSAVARFLARHGAGLHHLAYRVEDIDAVLAQLSAAGVALIDRTARPGAHGQRVAFIHPRSSGGVLVELVERRAHE